MEKSGLMQNELIFSGLLVLIYLEFVMVHSIFTLYTKQQVNSQ
jgi:hypothetical protein